MFKVLVNVTVTIITLMNFFLKINSIQELIKNTFLENIINIKYRNIIVIIILLIGIICWIISFFVEKKKSLSMEKKKHELFHEIRNESFSVKKFTEYQRDEYNTVAKTIAEKFCDDINGYFKEKYNRDYHICLKVLEVSSSRATKSIDEIHVKTLGRGGHDKVYRMNRDSGPVAVKEDTSYTSILSNEKEGRKSSYTCHNLPLYCLLRKATGHPYLPKFSKFHEKYLSTIVVPIRIDNEYLPVNEKYGSQNESRYQVLGFLCLDYKSIMSKHTAKCLSEDLKSIADSLYIIFDEIVYNDEKLKKRSCFT